MKVIIDIPEDMFEWFKNGEIIDEYDKSALKQVFQNGTPVDDVKVEIGKQEFTHHQGLTHWYMTPSEVKSIVFEILDNISKESEEE